MLSDRDICVDEIKYFRNIKDLARRYYDRFILDTNVRARRSDALLVEAPDAAEAQ